jgi:hypothetical protein
MTRTLHPTLALLVKPIPNDFAPNFVEQKVKGRGTFVRWSDTLTVTGHGPADVELGFSKANGKADLSAELANLRAGAWQAMELARLGRMDLLGYCLVSRHKSHPVSIPGIKAKE